MPFSYVNCELRFWVCGRPVLDVFQGRGSWSFHFLRLIGPYGSHQKPHPCRNRKNAAPTAARSVKALATRASKPCNLQVTRHNLGCSYLICGTLLVQVLMVLIRVRSTGVWNADRQIVLGWRGYVYVMQNRSDMFPSVQTHFPRPCLLENCVVDVGSPSMRDNNRGKSECTSFCRYCCH